MPTNGSAHLRQALIEVEQLRQRETEARCQAESLLEGLQTLTAADTVADGLDSVLALLGNAISFNDALIVGEEADGTLCTLAVTNPALSFDQGTGGGAIWRALEGEYMQLTDAVDAPFWDELKPGAFANYRSAILAPIEPVPTAAAIVCLHRERGQFGDAEREILRYFQPLAAQAIQHSAKIEQLAEAVRELEHARDRALSADRAKSEFLATMSHEMRTPMNGILGMVELLSISNLDERQAKQVETLRGSGLILHELIESVLDVSSLELNAARIEVGTVEPHSVVRKVIDAMAMTADQKDLWLRWEIAEDVPEDGVGDARRLEQLMRNLIGNSIKFTPTGGIDLRLSRGGGQSLLIEVIDTGPGVPEEQRERIFEKFYRGRVGPHTPSGGIGLGLSICRDIVSLMGGQIGVRAAETGGACFWILVPDVFPAADPASDTAPPAGAAVFFRAANG